MRTRIYLIIFMNGGMRTCIYLIFFLFVLLACADHGAAVLMVVPFSFVLPN